MRTCCSDASWGINVINSLAPGRSECHSKNVIFNHILLIGFLWSSHDNTLWWMPQDLTDDKSTLVQVMAWCRQATSHCLSQCWISSLSPYGVTRPQWINSLSPRRCVNNLKSAICEQMLQINLISTSCEITLRRMPQNTFHGKSANVDPDLCCYMASPSHKELTKGWVTCSMHRYHKSLLNFPCLMCVYGLKTKFAVFNPRPLRPKGYCRHLRLSVCPSVCLSVCLSVCSHHPC